MKVVRCSDDTYAVILEHAAQRGYNITRAVDELVAGQADYLVPSGIAGAEEITALVRQEVESKEHVLMADTETAIREIIRDELKIMNLERENQALKAELEKANTHHRLGDIIAHAGDACADCRQDLEQYNQRTIKAALEGLDTEAVRQLALQKGVLPKILKFEIP